MLAWQKAQNYWDISELECYLIEQYDVVFQSPASYYNKGGILALQAVVLGSSSRPNYGNPPCQSAATGQKKTKGRGKGNETFPFLLHPAPYPQRERPSPYLYEIF